MQNPTAIARVTNNHQVSIPKPVRDAIGLVLGDLVELTAKRGTIVIRPKYDAGKPIPEAVATSAELHAIKRGRAEVAAGETVPYEQYRAKRAARLERQPRQKRAKAAR